MALGAACAALASAGLVYWIGSSQDRTPSAAAQGRPEGEARSSPAHTAYAPPRPDVAQVARAYEQLQEIYAEQGSEAVMAFDRACAESLRGDPGVLDFCLAFDIYAASLASEDAGVRAWQAQTAARDLALAQNALPPGADAAARLAQVRALARQVSQEGAPAEPRAAPAQSPAPAQSGKSEARGAASACGLRATAAQRTVCASPALKTAERRLRLTYRRALAAGVSPSRLAHDQARFRDAVNAAGADRTEVARLYHRRTRALEEEIRAAGSPASAERNHQFAG